MKIIDTPFSFPDRVVFRGVEVRFLNLMEMFQGGPEIGNLSIFIFSPLQKARFTGPFVIVGDHLLVTRFERRIWSKNFSFFAFDVQTLQYIESSFHEDCIIIKRIEGTSIFYSKSISDNREFQVDFYPDQGFIRVK